MHYYFGLRNDLYISFHYNDILKQNFNSISSFCTCGVIMIFIFIILQLMLIYFSPSHADGSIKFWDASASKF